MLNTHAEKNLVINGKQIVYNGLYRSDEIFAAINRALEEKGYTKREKMQEETVVPEGKKTFVELRPFKVKTNYVTLMIKIKVTMDATTQAVEEVHGVKRKFNQGNLLVNFDAWSITDYHARWGMKPFVFFAKGFINKFIWPLPMESGFTGELTGDTAYIFAQVKKLLDSYKYDVGKRVDEEEVRKQVEEDIKKEEDLAEK